MELFYQRGAGEDGGSAEAYARPESKKTLMLHYIFVTALLLEDCQLAPAQVCRLFSSEINLVLHHLGTSSQGFLLLHLQIHVHIHVLAASFQIPIYIFFLYPHIPTHLLLHLHKGIVLLHLHTYIFKYQYIFPFISSHNHLPITCSSPRCCRTASWARRRCAPCFNLNSSVLLANLSLLGQD